jgi:hypothetical protein
MILSKRSAVLLLMSLTFFTVFLRYPLSSFEDSPSSSIGETINDGMVYHWHTRVIVDKGIISTMILSPLGFFGMYPFSYPSASQTTVAALTLSTGQDISPLIIGHDFFLGLISIGSMFMLSLEFKKNNLFAFLSTFVYNTHWYYLNQTIWFLSLRGHFTAFLPLLVWAFIRYFNIFESAKISRISYHKFLLIFASLYFIALASHRMVAFVIPTLFLPLFLIKMFLTPSLKNRIQHIKNGRQISVILGVLTSVVVFLAVYFGEFFDAVGLPSYEPAEGAFDKYPFFGILNLLINLGAIYLSQGLLQFFSILGLIVIITPQIRYKGELALLSLALFQARFLVDVNYFMPVASLLLSLLTGIGILFTTKYFSKYRPVWNVVFLVSLLVISSFYISYVKKINTSVELEIEGIDIGQGIPPESWNSVHWSIYYVEDDSGIIFTDARAALPLLSTNIYRSTYTDSILMHDSETKDRLIVEPLGAFDIFFNQRTNSTYGGDAYDPAYYVFEDEKVKRYAVGDTFYHYKIIFGDRTDVLLLERFNINYVVIGYLFVEEVQAEQPFFVDVHENSFFIYQNEIGKVLFYRNYE